MKIKKGDFGYVHSQKIKRGVMTALGFAVPIGVLIFGIVTTGTRANIFTIIAIVGCLPACQSLVGFIMMMMEKPMDPKLHKEIEAHRGKLEMAYEACITMEDAKLMIDAAAFCGTEIVCYAAHPAKRELISKFEKYLQSTIRKDDYPVHVKVFDQKKNFLERLDSLRDKEVDYESIDDPKADSWLSLEHRIREHYLGLAL